MSGRETLMDVRAELEAAIPKGPTSGGTIAETLRRFLHAREKALVPPSPAKPEIAPALNEPSLPPGAGPALELGR